MATFQPSHGDVIYLKPSGNDLHEAIEDIDTSAWFIALDSGHQGFFWRRRSAYDKVMFRYGVGGVRIQPFGKPGDKHRTAYATQAEAILAAIEDERRSLEDYEVRRQRMENLERKLRA